MDDAGKINAPRQGHADDSHVGAPRTARKRPLVSISEVIDVAADVFDVGRDQIMRRGFATTPVAGARACVIIVVTELGYQARDVARAFYLTNARNVMRLADMWGLSFKEDLRKARAFKLREVRDEVNARVKAIEGQRNPQTKFDDIHDVRNKKIRSLYANGKGWSVKGLAKMFDLEPVVVCDVLGLDRSFAKW